MKILLYRTLCYMYSQLYIYNIYLCTVYSVYRTGRSRLFTISYGFVYTPKYIDYVVYNFLVYIKRVKFWFEGLIFGYPISAKNILNNFVLLTFDVFGTYKRHTSSLPKIGSSLNCGGFSSVKAFDLTQNRNLELS